MFLLRTVLFVLLLGSLFLTLVCVADEPRRIITADASKQGVGQNIGFVEKLINESAAAKQILQSDNQEALALREKAIALLDEARAAQVQGNAEAAAQALNKAKQAIFAGMRLVGGKVVKDKRQENYQKKRHGLESLLAAHQRIRKENEQKQDVSVKAKSKASQQALQTESHVLEKMQEAQVLYDKGKLVDAGAVLNDAYLSLKVSLVKLRDGKTLVRSLHFETKQDEYRYELSRNDTHNLLINTVLKEKRADPRLGKLMDVPLKKAEQLRREAVEQAGRGDFDAAIKTLEDSTKYIIRAIRMAGIYIPG